MNQIAGQGFSDREGISYFTKNYRFRYAWTSIHTGTSMNGRVLGCRA
jgi:hypothetical protein